VSSTPFVSSDVDLLWSKDGSDIYFKLFDFLNSFQIYVEANHVDDAINAKPFHATIILFSQFYNPAILFGYQRL
jgi:hypothetical protein